jgi:MFS family permease
VSPRAGSLRVRAHRPIPRTLSPRRGACYVARAVPTAHARARFPARQTSDRALRRSLAFCTAEGATAEVVGVCCGNATGAAALTGWAIHLGMTPALIGLVAALPVATQMLQVVGAFLTARFGARRTTVVAVALSRQAFLPLAILPWLPLGADGKRVLLLAAAGAHHGLGILANNGWNAWFGEMVPARIRGRYFGRRTAICTVAGGACGLAAGVALDGAAGASAAGPVLQAMAALACALGAVSVWLLSQQHAPTERREPVRWAIHAARRPLADPHARRVIAYVVAWNAACGLSAPFFGLYVLRDLRAGYAAFAACGAGYAVARIASSSAWGRAVDRVGAKRVVALCTAGLALSPAAWAAAAPGRLWPLALETMLGGLLFGGHAIGVFALPLAIAPRRERPFYLAAVAVAGGAAFAATSALAGALVGDPARFGHVPLRALLVASAALRLASVAAALALPAAKVMGRAREEAAPMPEPAYAEPERRVA